MNGAYARQGKDNAPPVAGMSGELPPPPSLDPTHQKIPDDQTGTEGMREEEGGTLKAGVPSALDKGAMEASGEAAGTHTSPGPTAEEVRKHRQQVGLVSGDGSETAGMARQADGGDERIWSVGERMEPHLQLM
jgi:hypothetical protein